MTTATHPRSVRGVELLLVVLLLSIAVERGRDEAWPFIAWTMYSWSFAPTPQRVSEIQLRLLGRDGRVTKVMPYAIFGHVEIELGREVAARAFEDRPDQGGYRDVLMRRLQPLLSASGAVEVQGWRLTWRVRARELPPFDLEHPSEERLLGRIDCSQARTGASRGQGASP